MSRNMSRISLQISTPQDDIYAGLSMSDNVDFGEVEAGFDHLVSGDIFHVPRTLGDLFPQHRRSLAFLNACSKERGRMVRSPQGPSLAADRNGTVCIQCTVHLPGGGATNNLVMLRGPKGSLASPRPWIMLSWEFPYQDKNGKHHLKQRLKVARTLKKAPEIGIAIRKQQGDDLIFLGRVEMWDMIGYRVGNPTKARFFFECSDALLIKLAPWIPQ